MSFDSFKDWWDQQRIVQMEALAEEEASRITMYQNSINGIVDFFRQAFGNPQSLLADKLADIYSYALTNTQDGKSFSVENDLFDIVESLADTPVYTNAINTIPGISKLLDGYVDNNESSIQTTLKRLGSVPTSLSDSFKTKFTESFVNSIVSGSGLDNFITDQFKDSNSPLRTSYSNMLNFIKSQSYSGLSKADTRDLSNLTSVIEDTFYTESYEQFSSLLKNQLQPIYTTYKNILNKGEINQKIVDSLFGTTGIFAKSIDTALTEIETTNNAIIEYLELAIIDDAVNSYEDKLQASADREIAKLQSSLASQRGLNESSMMFANLLHSQNIEMQVAEYRSSLQLKVFDVFHQYTVQKENLMVSSYGTRYQQELTLKATEVLQIIQMLLQSVTQSIAMKFEYLNQRAAEYVQGNSQLTQLLGTNLNAYNLQKTATQLQFRANIASPIYDAIKNDRAFRQQDYQIIHDINKTLYLADFDVFKNTTQLKVDDSFKRLTTMQHAFNAMASIHGGVVKTEIMPTLQTALSSSGITEGIKTVGSLVATLI